jgi:hypothetical protein
LLELIELLGILNDRVQLASSREPVAGWPLVLHRHYQRREISAAVGHWTPTAKPQWREGLLRIDEARVELFLVTLDKSGSGFSPTTRYEDYAISPRLFHWQTQSTTSDQSPTGRRYLEQHTNGWRFLLFVRGRPREAYTLLGDVRYRDHRGNRPISITWELEESIPAALFQRYATLVAA